MVSTKFRDSGKKTFTHLWFSARKLGRREKRNEKLETG
jgi:hypothetical protein